MRKIISTLLCLLGLSTQAIAADNYAATAGSGLTFAAKDAAGVLYSRFIGCDNTTVAQCWTVDSSGRLLGYLGSGAVVDLGAIADAAATAGSTGSVNAKLRLITTQLDTISSNTGSAIPAGSALIGQVALNQSSALLSATNGIYSNCLLGNAACATGTGSVGSTSQRVAVGTDAATVAGSTPAVAGFAAIGAAPPTGSQQMGAVGSGATGGLMQAPKICDLHAVYDASDNGSKEMIAAVSGRTIYICGFIMATGGTATNLKLVDGTGTDCATGTPTNLTPAYQLVANDKIGANAAFWNGLKASGTNRAVCINASAGNAHQAEIWYTIQ